MKRGYVVLTPFPFTDLTGYKPRPALVVSRSDRAGSDVVLAFITTYTGVPLLPSDLLIEQSHTDFPQSGLRRSSVVKLDKLVTIEKSLVLGQLGELSASLMQEVNSRLIYSLELA